MYVCIYVDVCRCMYIHRQDNRGSVAAYACAFRTPAEAAAYIHTHTHAHTRTHTYLRMIRRVHTYIQIPAKAAAEHTSAYVSIRQRKIRRVYLHNYIQIPAKAAADHTSTYVSIRQNTSAYVSIRQHTSAKD
jgi:hypothetical protein